MKFAKKALTIALCLSLSLTFAQAAEVTSLNGNLMPHSIEVQENPALIVAADYAVLDLMDALGLADRLVGISKGAAPE